MEPVSIKILLSDSFDLLDDELGMEKGEERKSVVLPRERELIRWALGRGTFVDSMVGTLRELEVQSVPSLGGSDDDDDDDDGGSNSSETTVRPRAFTSPSPPTCPPAIIPAPHLEVPTTKVFVRHVIDHLSLVLAVLVPNSTSSSPPPAPLLEFRFEDWNRIFQTQGEEEPIRYLRGAGWIILTFLPSSSSNVDDDEGRSVQGTIQFRLLFCDGGDVVLRISRGKLGEGEMMIEVCGARGSGRSFKVVREGGVVDIVRAGEDGLKERGGEGRRVRVLKERLRIGVEMLALFL